MNILSSKPICAPIKSSAKARLELNDLTNKDIHPTKPHNAHQPIQEVTQHITEQAAKSKSTNSTVH